MQSVETLQRQSYTRFGRYRESTKAGQGHSLFELSRDIRPVRQVKFKTRTSWASQAYSTATPSKSSHNRQAERVLSETPLRAGKHQSDSQLSRSHAPHFHRPCTPLRRRAS